MSMTPAARKLLATTVRALRARLLGAPDGLAPPAAHALLHRLVVLHMLAARATAGPDDVAELARRALAPDADPEHAALGRASAALAVELPGLFGPPATRDVPPAVLRHAIAALAHPDLTPCWTDDLTPGWAHQSWNDPEREALDARLHARARLEPHEIASKTQLFSERYLVDWLLHNSLGPLWLAICARNGWTAEVVADGTLARLEARRAAWRARRARGEVDPGEPLPLHGDAEPLWAHYMPQPLAADAVEHAPASVRDVALLDPAVGAGHVLIAAFDLLLALHREEARHRGEVGRGAWTDRRIVEHIVEHNLHGVDIDARPVQITTTTL